MFYYVGIFLIAPLNTKDASGVFKGVWEVFKNEVCMFCIGEFLDGELSFGR
jgi:hypothetical protein